MPEVKPINEIKYTFKQSKHEHVPRVPYRAMIVGPSGSGKSCLLVNFILDIYRGVHDRIFIWSPSIHVDSIWLPVKKYITEEMKIDTEKEPCFFEFHSEDLQKVIDTQHKITEYCKKQKMTKLFNIFCILDDISDDPKVSRHNKLLNQLYVRGRHQGINVITSLQQMVTVPRIIRVNATHLFIYKVRNFREIEILQEEFSAVVRKGSLQESKKVIYDLYEEATNEPHSFLFIDLLQKDPDKMFLKNFTHYLRITN